VPRESLQLPREARGILASDLSQALGTATIASPTAPENGPPTHRREPHTTTPLTAVSATVQNAAATTSKGRLPELERGKAPAATVVTEADEPLRTQQLIDALTRDLPDQLADLGSCEQWAQLVLPRLGGSSEDPRAARVRDADAPIPHELTDRLNERHQHILGDSKTFAEITDGEAIGCFGKLLDQHRAAAFQVAGRRA
jgi:hypothetical protein